MRLMTKAIEKKIPKLYAQDGKGESAIVYVKFFLPGTRWTWYVTEFDGKDTFFGYVISGIDPSFDEWGYASLKELEMLTLIKSYELKVERDLYFEPKTLREVLVEEKL